MTTQPLQPQRGRLVPQHDRNRVPNCQKCGQAMELVGESEVNWQFGCRRCQCAHVFSKPQARAAAQYRAQLERQLQHQQRVRAHDSRTKYFFLQGGE